MMSNNDEILASASMKSKTRSIIVEKMFDYDKK